MFGDVCHCLVYPGVLISQPHGLLVERKCLPRMAKLTVGIPRQRIVPMLRRIVLDGLPVGAGSLQPLTEGSVGPPQAHQG